MRFYYQAENGFTELKYHGKASRLPTYRDGRVYGTYTRADGTVISYKDKEYKYGEYEYTDPVDILVPFDTSYTIMDEQSSTKITLLCSDQEVIAPGTLVQLVYFKNDDGSWLPQDKDGKPHNYSNWVILSSNAQYFDHIDVHGKRYKHTYDMEEALTCFKDYPVRSSKTFAGGRYTYREVLDITLRLFFKPRVHESTFAIKDNPVLDEPNSKLSYTNATVFDVVADIGRILDLTPNVEVKYEDGKYVYTLEYLPNYGTIGEEVDISYFDLANADTETSTRDTHAGAVISNVQNLVTDEGTSYPAPGVGLYPGVTNANADQTIYELPYAIREIKEIKVYHRPLFDETYNSKGTTYEDDNGGSIRIGYWKNPEFFIDDLDMLDPLLYSNISKEKPLIITPQGSSADPVTTWVGEVGMFGTEENVYGAYAEMRKYVNPVLGASHAKYKQLFVASDEEKKVLYPSLDDKTMQTQENTISYSIGGRQIDLSPLFESYFYVGTTTRKQSSMGDSDSYTMWAKFSNKTAVYTGDFGVDNNKKPTITIKPLIEIKVVPLISAVIKGENDVQSDTTVFFNQYGQVVSAEAFSNAIGNYADEMSGASRIVGKIAEPVGGKNFYDLYKELPQVGCTVVDHERNKRYVLSQLSVTRQPQSLDILAQLNERKKGRSQVVQADSQQYLAQIPDSEIQPSYTSASFNLYVSTRQIRQKQTDEFDFATTQLAEMMLNPIAKIKHYDNVFLSSFYPLDESNTDNNEFLLVPIIATTKDTVIFSHTFYSNRVAGAKEENVLLYTDKSGIVKRASFQMYYTNNPDEIVENFPLFTNPFSISKLFVGFEFDLHKDSYETTSITVQSTIKPCENLLIGRNYISRTPFGKQNELDDEPLTVCFYDRQISTEKEQSIAQYTAQANQIDGQAKIDLRWEEKTPTHKAWALKRGNDILVYQNEPIEGQSIVLYWALTFRLI